MTTLMAFSLPLDCQANDVVFSLRLFLKRIDDVTLKTRDDRTLQLTVTRLRDVISPGVLINNT